MGLESAILLPMTGQSSQALGAVSTHLGGLYGRDGRISNLGEQDAVFMHCLACASRGAASASSFPLDEGP